MKISVVIPVYNEEKYIRACLESLTKQEIPPDEVIIVDNNCTDKTIAIANEYGAHVVTEKMQGILAARNAGFSAAHFDIIARTDADARFPADWIKKIKHNFESSTIDALGGAIVYQKTLFPSTWYSNMFYFILNIVQGHHTLVGSNMALRKDMWEKIKNEVCTDEKKVHEDADIAIHIHKKGGIIRYDSHLLATCSPRRIVRKPASFFGEYPIRLIRTILNH